MNWSIKIKTIIYTYPYVINICVSIHTLTQYVINSVMAEVWGKCERQLCVYVNK